MGFEELAGRRVRLQHSLDPLAQVRVLATPLGDVRSPLIGREFAGGIEDFLFAISVCAHDTGSASTKDYAFSNSKRSNRIAATGFPDRE
jgi:hypothetical protein